LNRARVAALVLAAGSSTRFGPENKLVAQIGGAALATHAVDAVLGAGADPVFVVTGHDAASVSAVLGDRPLHFVHNEDHARGMGSSIAVGAQALLSDDAPIDGVLITLADMPDLRSKHVRPLLEALDHFPPGGTPILVPTFESQRGHPVLFHHHYLRALSRLTGDQGARSILETDSESIHEVAIASQAILLDQDHPPSSA